jgi:hypothetical protein
VNTRGVELALPLEEQVGEVRRYTIVLPFLPVSKNRLNSWPPMYQASDRDKWHRAIVRECIRQNMPKGVPKIGLAAELQFPTYVKRRDPQNYIGRLWHYVPDALIAPKPHHLARQAREPSYPLPYGLIKDDYDGMIEWGPHLSVKFGVDTRHVPKEQKGLTIIKIVMRVP